MAGKMVNFFHMVQLHLSISVHLNLEVLMKLRLKN